eukprot:CAMPEP_0178920252 /NCGR_PEP_ID=MMETSP0786-20121207/14903_1 /TAXON_ID=186022 /ORGANISM="Thalassionema frauenfeldii, Strain CCMP 1798" /LENGTH=89 /DNA_ID=CAMNT_0020594301 /DNA_START=284 /DNA_END=553 /DNA_ORIENTATION=-
MKKSRKSRALVARIVGGTVGLSTLGPGGAVLFGCGSAVTTKEIGKQKERKLKRKINGNENRDSSSNSTGNIRASSSNNNNQNKAGGKEC